MSNTSSALFRCPRVRGILLVIACCWPAIAREVLADEARPAAAAPCQVLADKRAEPERVTVGEEIAITLASNVVCDGGGRLDTVLVMDSSLDMGGARMGHARESVGAYADAVDLNLARVGLVAYSGYVEVLSPLTGDRQALEEAATKLFPKPGSDLAAGLATAGQVLQQGRSAAGTSAAEAVVVLSGSEFDNTADEVVAEADALRADGVVVAVVAYGGNADVATLERVASSRELLVVEGLSHRLPEVFASLAVSLGRASPVSASVVDELPQGMTYVWGSGSPAPRVRGRELGWSYAVWPTQGITITYALRPQSLGRQQTNARAEIEVTFDRGDPLVREFPVPVVDVGPPPSVTATPGASGTPEGSATPTDGIGRTPSAQPTPTGPTAPATADPTPFRVLLPCVLVWRAGSRSAGRQHIESAGREICRPEASDLVARDSPTVDTLRPYSEVGYSAP